MSVSHFFLLLGTFSSSLLLHPPLLFCNAVSLLLRHKGSLREAHGAVEWGRLLSRFNREERCVDVSDWRTQEWIDHLPRGSNKQKFQYCLDSMGKCLYMRDLQGHSGGNKVEPTLQDTVEIPYRWVEHIYHTGSAFHCNTIIQTSLIDKHASFLRRTP